MFNALDWASSDAFSVYQTALFLLLFIHVCKFVHNYFEDRIWPEVKLLLCVHSVCVIQKLTFPNKRWIWPSLLKINDNTTLNLLHQRLQTLVQHPLCPHAVRSP